MYITYVTNIILTNTVKLAYSKHWVKANKFLRLICTQINLVIANPSYNKPRLQETPTSLAYNE